MMKSEGDNDLPVSPGAIQRVVHAEALALPPAPVQVPLEPHKPHLTHILWRRKFIVLASIVLTLGGGIAYMELLATPIYVAASRLYLQASGPSIMGRDTSEVRQGAINLNTECQVIRSGPILADALAAPGIKDLRTFTAGKLEGEGSPLATLALSLSVTPGKSDDLITVSFESPYAEDTYQIVNAVVEAYKANQSKSKQNTAKEVLKILNSEKSRRDEEIKAAVEGVLDFKKDHPELLYQEGDRGANIIIQRLGQLSVARTEAEIALTDANSEYDAVQALQGDPAKLGQYIEAKRRTNAVYVAPQNDEIVSLRNELNALKVMLRSTQLTEGRDHRGVDNIQKRIAEVQRLIEEHDAKEASGIVGALKQQQEARKNRLESVKASYDKQMREAEGLNKDLAEYTKRQNEADRLKRLVESLDSRIKELQVTENVGAMNIKVLEAAGLPIRPAKPEKPKIVGIAAALGVLLGIGLAMVRNWMDPRITSADEISSLLGVPVVGVLPRIKGRPGLPRLGRNVLDAPLSPGAEAYRGIRTALHFGLPGRGAKTVLVTSPAAGDGKSTLISNLAITMSQSGLRTLVVDADLRSPRQHEIFGIANHVGLVNALTGESSLADAIHLNGDHGPDVLPAGRVQPYMSEVLNGRGLVELIRRLSETYDQILIDSPPVLSVTDSLVLAAICDVTILVVRAERSHRKMAEQAREGLLSVGAGIFGAVVNDVKKNTSRYGGYYRYYAGREISPDASRDEVEADKI